MEDCDDSLDGGFIVSTDCFRVSVKESFWVTDNLMVLSLGLITPVHSVLLFIASWKPWNHSEELADLLNAQVPRRNNRWTPVYGIVNEYHVQLSITEIIKGTSLIGLDSITGGHHGQPLYWIKPPHAVQIIIIVCLAGRVISGHQDVIRWVCSLRREEQVHCQE